MRLVALVATLLAPIAAACSVDSTSTSTPSAKPPTGTLGKEQKLGFEFHNSKRSCELCTMMEGTQEALRFDPMQPADVIVESSDPSVVLVGEGTSKFIHDGITEASGFGVKAVKAGTAEIRVKRASGEIVDRIDLAVAVPREVVLVGDVKTVKVGQQVTFVATAIGPDGKRLESTDGWSFAGDAPRIAQVIDGCGIACFGSRDFLFVKGVAPGTVNASAKGAGVAGTVTVTVTP